jgi:hypothetical protein
MEFLQEYQLGAASCRIADSGQRDSKVGVPVFGAGLLDQADFKV